MNYVLFDDPGIQPHLLPFTFTRPVCHLRVGILTIAEKWKHWLGVEPSSLTQPHLRKKYGLTEDLDNVLINGAVCPNDALVEAIQSLGLGEALVKANRLIALRTDAEIDFHILHTAAVRFSATEFALPITIIAELCDIFVENGQQIREDFALLTQGRTSQPITDPHTVVYNAAGIFLEEGVTTKAAILNAERGPIYLGRNSMVMEGAVVRGPFAMGEGSIVNVGGRMIGDNTLGPYCKVGGEVSNSVLMGYSNKVHDGFLGNSVLGEWCNLGAGTNNSNMKNNYSDVKLWSYAEKRLTDTKRLFCGLMMGDYSKTAIGTMFNTGTVVGVCANVFGNGQPAKYVPSFAWGATDQYRLPDAIDAIGKAMERRGKGLDEVNREILEVVFEME
jgi:UDP-N-acetylglucosamine diphosphorylase / glucose-1-phosphate thymidylyltransferase / UDP-N-acetylgalactosamine diphosphorylase / glucosamine-1-phosphate N-acetyltransferase / galactosamine-1-phosphate N-acetyltransferase